MKDIDKAVKVLNEALKADRKTTEALLNKFEICNDKYAEHPHIVVMRHKGDKRSIASVLGLVNGVVHALTGEYVCVEMDKGKYLKFSVYKPTKSKTK